MFRISLMQIIWRFLPLIPFFFFFSFLTQCTAITKMPRSSISAKSQLINPYPLPATVYLAQAKQQKGVEQQESLLLAVTGLIYEGQWRQSLDILRELVPLTNMQAYKKSILTARIALIRGQAQEAITHLSKVRDVSSLPNFYQVEYHQSLANAYEKTHKVLQALNERIKLETLLPPNKSANNQKLLWQNLSKLPTAELHALAVETKAHSTLQGWIELALLSRGNRQHKQLYQALQHWQGQYPNHPAQAFLASSLIAMKPDLRPTPQQVALLLPLTGPLAGPGNAIREGFIAAAQQARSSKNIRTYDTAASSISTLYQQALSEGAEYIIGPLSKADVAEVAALAHPVPTILLNDISTKEAPNLYRFGLSPSNEAKAVALKAAADGYRRALVIAPQGVWGDDIVGAFRSQWQGKGGIIVDHLSYELNGDLSKRMREFLQVSSSLEREKQLKNLLGPGLQTISGRRQDFDIIFLLAYPSKARQIVPLLKYYFAGDVPIYATSSVYSGHTNIMKDKDLNGIIFCDLPWVFSQQMANKNWPEQFNSYNRLYALGRDSYALTTHLNQLLLFPSIKLNDKSGTFYLSRAQQIARIHAWGQFRHGIAVELN